MSCSTNSFRRRPLLLLALVVGFALPVAGGEAQPAGVWGGAAAQDKPAAAGVAVPRRIAVLPFINLSGTRVPRTFVENVLKHQLRLRGFYLLEEEALATFMRNHRLRYTGGVDVGTAVAFREETGVDAVLVTALEAFREGPTPQVTLHGRLVSADSPPTILWADSVGRAGDEAPGLLGLGLVTDPEQVVRETARRLVVSLDRANQAWRNAARASAAGGGEGVAGGRLMFGADLGDDAAGRFRPRSRHRPPAIDVAAEYGKRFRPRTHFRSPVLDRSSHYSVAVMPFLNVSERKHADMILALHFVEQLLRHGGLTVMEPGAVREELLRTRSIMVGGPSLAVADLFFHREYPEIDLILSGQVFDYQDQQGIPKVDFSVQVFERTTRKVVWFSRSFNEGDEDVVFFDLARQHTAHALVTKMVDAATELMMR